jgi:hypothetical protein
MPKTSGICRMYSGLYQAVHSRYNDSATERTIWDSNPVVGKRLVSSSNHPYCLKQPITQWVKGILPRVNRPELVIDHCSLPRSGYHYKYTYIFPPPVGCHVDGGN